MSVLVLLAATGLATAAPTTARAQHRAYGAPEPERPRRESPGRQVTTEEPSKPDQTIEIAVTEDGFEPSSVTVKKGERVRIVVKRKTDDTPVREFILDEFLVWKRLPLNEAVWEEFVTGRTGAFAFRSLNGAVTGTLNVVD